jgi:adenylate kinase
VGIFRKKVKTPAKRASESAEKTKLVVIFGTIGSGKSVQGQLLAARNGWRWLSAGQLLRDANDPKITKVQHGGTLVDDNIVNRVLKNALTKAEKEVPGVILDGYPRTKDQTDWLITEGFVPDLAILLDVPHREIKKRLRIRGRGDDISEEALENRFQVFENGISDIRKTLRAEGVHFVEVDGDASVGTVHDRVMNKIEKYVFASKN